MASPARHQSLASSPLHEDSEDVFFYPSAAPRHSGFFGVHSSTPLTHAGVLLGERLVVGAFAGRATGSEALERRAGLFPDLQLRVPDPMVTALVAMRLDSEHSVGLSVAASHLLERTTSAEFGDNGTMALGVGLVTAHTYNVRRGPRVDSALVVDFSHFRRTERFELVTDVPLSASIGVRHRSIWPLSPQWQLGAWINARRDDLFVDRPAAGRSADGSAWDLSMGVGARTQPSEAVTASLEVLGGRTLWEVDALLSPPRRSLAGGEAVDLLPAFRGALEGRLGESMTVRMGWMGGRESRTSTDGVGNFASLQGSFSRWFLGVGFAWDGFRLDGVLQQALLEEGPALLGGREPGLFTSVSASYLF